MIGLVTLAACGAPTTAFADGRSAIDGVWRSEGHGTTLSISDGHLIGYDTTAVSCLPGSLRAERIDSGDRFHTNDGLIATVRPRRHGKAWLSFDGMLGTRELTRLPGDPALRQRIAEVADQNPGVPKQDIHHWAGGAISYADLPNALGYLRITGFTGYTEDNTFAAGKAELDRALDMMSPMTGSDRCAG